MRIAIGPGWSSHLPITMALLSATKGPVVELGCGIYSTPVMHWSCRERGRWLTSYETNDQWLDRFSRFERGRHKLVKVDDWKQVDLSRPVGLALVDHKGTASRYRQAMRLAHAEFVIVHDAARCMRDKYRRSKIRNAFKHRYRYARFHPETLILSNSQNPQEVLSDFELTEQA